MKLKDLKGLAAGQAYRDGRGNTVLIVESLNYAGLYAVTNKVGETCHINSVEDSDWQLLAQQPQLGEEIDISDLAIGDTVAVRRCNERRLYEGMVVDTSGGASVEFLHPSGAVIIKDSLAAYKIYRHARPFPSLPEPPSLREKLTDTLQKYGISPGPGQTYPLLNELEALLESERKS